MKSNIKVAKQLVRIARQLTSDTGDYSVKFSLDTFFDTDNMTYEQVAIASQMLKEAVQNNIDRLDQAVKNELRKKSFKLAQKGIMLQGF